MQTVRLFDLRVSKQPKFCPVHKAVQEGWLGGGRDELICMRSGESARVTEAFLIFLTCLLLW